MLKKSRLRNLRAALGRYWQARKTVLESSCSRGPMYDCPDELADEGIQGHPLKTHALAGVCIKIHKIDS